jgi:FkbM family methyltransferase
VLSELEFKTGGFFVEFGAANGVDLSNTYLLEKNFGWRGILAEPGRAWYADLKKNRTGQIDTRCVWKESNSILTFNETDYGEYSTIDSFSSLDIHAADRETGQRYSVETISLIDLLGQYGAPRTIDYLSIDTEGSEYDILSSFDFSKYEFRVITCEHNFTPLREKLHLLLTEKGYVRKLQSASHFDDWYVRV